MGTAILEPPSAPVGSCRKGWITHL
ncbi:hypothetical protein ARTHRO8AJ_50026 [Arthrobacter sp. 8AJ]|nr:hypothetical protein ARTHRO8AJ_50026 [Arthrobacter sp. 8AJ]